MERSINSCKPLLFSKNKMYHNLFLFLWVKRTLHGSVNPRSNSFGSPNSSSVSYCLFISGLHSSGLNPLKEGDSWYLGDTSQGVPFVTTWTPKIALKWKLLDICKKADYTAEVLRIYLLVKNCLFWLYNITFLICNGCVICNKIKSWELKRR